MPPVPAHRQLRGFTTTAVAVSLLVHGLVGAVIATAPRPNQTEAPPQIVELAVVQTPPPEPEPPPDPAPPVASPPQPPPRRPAKPKPVAVEAAPPPSALPPEPDLPPPEPVPGVSADTVAEAPADMAVPVGNTLAANIVNPDKPTPPAAGYVGGAVGSNGIKPFAPVAEGFVKQWPRTLNEVRAPYPEEARRLDVSGTVRLRVGIDEFGKVREVKVIKKAGYGLDEAASKAMWRFRFSPALGQDGQPVPFRINYDYTFTPGR